LREVKRTKYDDIACAHCGSSELQWANSGQGDNDRGSTIFHCLKCKKKTEAVFVIDYVEVKKA